MARNIITPKDKSVTTISTCTTLMKLFSRIVIKPRVSGVVDSHLNSVIISEKLKYYIPASYKIDLPDYRTFPLSGEISMRWAQKKPNVPGRYIGLFFVEYGSKYYKHCSVKNSLSMPPATLLGMMRYTCG